MTQPLQGIGTSGAGSDSSSPPIRRGEQSKVPFNAAIIGGGKACEDLLVLLSGERAKWLNMRILGVADPNPEAPGIQRAHRLGIFTTADFEELYQIPDLNLLIELTGSKAVRERMIRTKPLEVSSIDHRGARLLWDLMQLEEEKRQLERESEERLRLFLESAHDIICIKDLEGRYLYINPAAAESMGIHRDDSIGRTDFDIFPEPLAQAMASHDREVIVEKKTLSYKERLQIDGQQRHFNTVRFPIVDERGLMVSIAIIARDVTEEMALQEELLRNKEYLENIVTNSSDMIITTDLQGRIVTFNPGGERMLGYTRQEVIGTGIETLWKYPHERRKLMEEVQRRGAVSNYPATLIAKGGDEIEISLSLSQLKDDQGRILGTVGISKDVTEENRLRNQLIEQERLAAVGQTVAGVTHCMKNVLNGLKGGAYLVNVGLKRNEPKLLEEGWENVQAGINRISKLSLDMLSYCRDREPNRRPTDPLTLARDAVAIVSESAKQQGVELVCEGKTGLLVDLDPEALGRALLNLITNALDACKEKSYKQNETPRVTVTVTRDDGHVCFEVKDNGIGMDAETRNKLFTRFFSTKDAGGTGLGLCVTQKIAEEHGGAIRVDSRPGRGSSFVLVLPAEWPDQAGDTSKQ